MTSKMASMMQRGLGMLATATGQTLAYRPGTTGAWTALPSKSLLIEDMPTPMLYQVESHRAVVIPATAKLFVPFGSTHLRPGTILKGYQVQKSVAGTTTQWGVVSAQHIDGFSHYDCERLLPQSIGAVPGGI